MLTPSVKWFEVGSMNDDSDQERLSNVDNFMWYIIRKKIKSRAIISQLVRCMLLYGMPILKTSITIQNGQVWPTQRAVDPFAFYMYPETSSTIDDAEIIFEDFLFSYERYRTFVKKGLVDDIQRSELTKPDWPYHLTERLAYQGITDPTANVDVAIGNVSEQLQRTTNAFVSITEEWIRREGHLYQVYIAWNLVEGPRIVGFFQSQYDDPLYRISIHRALPGETYTNTQMEDLIELDNVQTDMFNQFVDSVDYEQGFVAFGGSEGMRRDTMKMKGRAKWDFGPESPREALQFIQPPVTSTNQLRAWQVVNAMMQSMGGAGTIAEGQPGRNMPRSGDAFSSMIALGMADIQDLAESIEQEVLTPGLSDIYKVASLIPDDQLMRIPNGMAVYGQDLKSNVLRKKDIIGDFEFEWIGSLQFQDDAQRAQRLMIFLNMAPQLMPPLEAQGYTLNIPELVQTIWRSGIGERSLSKVVITLQEMAAILQKQAAKSGQPMILPDIQQLIQQVKQGASQNGSSGGTSSSNGNGLASLKPNLPDVTSGFIK